MALLHSTRLYITLPWLYFTLLDSTLLFLGLTMALLHSTRLNFTIPWLYFTLLDSMNVYHSSTSLYLTLNNSSMDLLHSTWLYINVPCLYFILIDSTLSLPPTLPKDQPPPSPTSSTSSLTSFHSCNTSSQHNTLSPELFSPTPTSQNKWPSPPPLPQRSPRIRRRHNLHNYASLASTNRSQEKRNSVGAPPLDYLTPYFSLIHSALLYHGTTSLY